MSTYYVVFTDSKNKFLKWFRKGFRHVFVVKKMGDVGILLEDSFQGFYIDVISIKDFKLLTKQEKWTLIKVVKGDRSKKRFSIWYWTPTCVNFVKNVLGLHCKAQTPFQLYNYLLSEECKKWVVQLKKQLKK